MINKFLRPIVGRYRPGEEPILDMQDLINIYGEEFVRSRFEEGAESDSDEAEYNSDDDDSSDEGEDETQRIISYPVLDDPEFVNNLQWEDAIVYTDRIFFKADIMTSLQKYSSEMKTHFKVDWTVKTRCNNNRLNTGILDIATIGKACISVTKKYFCATNNDCVTKYDRNDSILRNRIKTSAKYVDSIDDLLSSLKNFKTCATCDRRLQVWVKEKDFAEISDLFEDPPDIIIPSCIFDDHKRCSFAAADDDSDFEYDERDDEFDAHMDKPRASSGTRQVIAYIHGAAAAAPTSMSKPPTSSPPHFKKKACDN
ncbi:hypothetical protein AGLY_014370 [Aphis glycines]|uniref:Uncharacterized protein n=1 Tax=Aphis glycines TaxID=307491 RepID=A0A6G0T463_APHGL|nr:hypothetical protein AGLY_014370 [Aphis glycines]